MVAGQKKSDYLNNTLFDDNAMENQGKKKLYKKEVVSYLECNSGKYLYALFYLSIFFIVIYNLH